MDQNERRERTEDSAYWPKRVRSLDTQLEMLEKLARKARKTGKIFMPGFHS